MDQSIDRLTDDVRSSTSTFVIEIESDESMDEICPFDSLVILTH